jgi:RNA polymerase sigma-70 factor (ECF subfamily)
VHRVTITRWLNRIKENLLEETRFGLAARLAVSGEELESIMRLIQSQLHVSIRGMLGEEPDADQ